MNGKKAAERHLLALLGTSTLLAALAATGCGSRADDINKVQPGYVKKSIFQQDSEWYYRRTVAKSETTNEYIIEGHGDIQLDRVKWRVEENLLIAYKPYEAIPGAQTGEYPGNTTFEGTVLAEFPILSHFDKKRGYDPQTGNETNVIEENASDRPWYEREFMRVDFSDNKVAGSFLADYAGYWIPVTYVSSATYWTNQDTAPTDEFASRFTDDYVEITHSALLGMDIWMCASFAGFSGAGYGQCGYGEAKIRHSFTRVKAPSDYVPRDYPDSYVRTDASGKSIADPVTGEVLREPIYNRFGVFRTETPTYDRGYGTTESGRLFRAMIFNIWDKHTGADGKPLAYKDRTPKPIIYYLNADFPDRWRDITGDIASEYDRVFKGLVTDLGVDPAKIPARMYEIRTNDCNVDNIRKYVGEHPDLMFAIERAVPAGRCPTGQSSCSALDKIAVGNLTTVCTSLEAASRDPKTNVPGFDWQRIGDNRHNMLVWLNNPQSSPWGGYGPMHSDARTGESVSATAFIRGFYYEVAASTIVDYIELINDEKNIDDIIYGQDIRKQVADDLRRRREAENAQVSPAYERMMGLRANALGTTREQRLRERDPQFQVNRMKLAQGTSIDDAVITDLDLMMASAGTWNPKRDGAPSADLRALASPLGRITSGNPYSPAAMKGRQALQRLGYCFMNYDFDIHWAGLALALKDLPRADRYKIVAGRLLKHVMLHELGHNVGLAHNFEGSYDALNYDDAFWAVSPHASEQDKIAAHYDEYRNSTVMEYMGQGKGLFSDYLGKYDEAAIRFVYGEQVAVFDSPAVDPNLEGGEKLRAWRYLSDYQSIPNHLCGGSGCSDDDRAKVVTTRKWVHFDPNDPPKNEVPFLFCDNTFDHMTPFCSTFDYGSNLFEIFENYHTNWASYFFFNNFLRDRLSPLAWSPDRAINPLINAMTFVDTVAQYYYYWNATMPGFVDLDVSRDMVKTIAYGMNMAAEVIATPEPTRMCPWPGSSNPEIYIPYYYQPDVCDHYADINSETSIRAKAIQLPLGDARPSTLGFTEDYEDWDWSFVGSYFDKSNVLWLLGYNRPRFFRFNYDLDRRSYDISLFRLYEPEIRTFFDSMVNLDGYFITSNTAGELGSYWCRNPTDPNAAHLGYFEPRRLVDPSHPTNPSLPGPSDTCLNPAVVYPSLLRNMPFSAMYYGHALFSSDWDNQFDLGKSMKVFVAGSDDDYPSWDQLPSDQICTCTDALTGIEYRSIHEAPGVPDIGCRLLDRACSSQIDYQGSHDNPNYKDRWRAWFERLEYARDLYRTFDQARVFRR